MMIRAISHLEVQYWEPPLFATLMILFIELELISEEKKKEYLKFQEFLLLASGTSFPKAALRKPFLVRQAHGHEGMGH